MERQYSNYRWVVLTCILLDYFLIVIQRTAPGLISDKLMEDFHVTVATIGVLTSIQFLAYAGFQIPVGTVRSIWPEWVPTNHWDIIERIRHVAV